MDKFAGDATFLLVVTSGMDCEEPQIEDMCSKMAGVLQCEVMHVPTVFLLHI